VKIVCDSDNDIQMPDICKKKKHTHTKFHAIFKAHFILSNDDIPKPNEKKTDLQLYVYVLCFTFLIFSGLTQKFLKTANVFVYL